MELKLIEGDKVSPKTMRYNPLDSITQVAQVHGGRVVSRCNEGGVVRMKIVVRKQEVKQMLAMMKSGKNNTHQASASSMSEQRLHSMPRKQHRRHDHVKGKWRTWTWRPALQSIPEEQNENRTC
ncbi:hypothetical protein NE237_018148 [Protea cynaroides]|uniref:Uncharacterized protein n=1 Tax=Protea cynaroides TaxID=273540 RepID=A0A9Q0QNX1_9MAGN|nr:hypothetical protein NE237_018148 [Protea cynaroides]